MERARATLQRQATCDLAKWTKHLGHLGNTTFACQADAEAVLAQALQRVPLWVQVQGTVKAVSKQAKPGRQVLRLLGPPYEAGSLALEQRAE